MFFRHRLTIILLSVASIVPVTALVGMEYTERSDLVVNQDSLQGDASSLSTNENEQEHLKDLSTLLKKIRQNARLLEQALLKKDPVQSVGQLAVVNDQLAHQAKSILNKLKTQTRLSPKFTMQIQKHYDELHRLIENSLVAPLTTLKKQFQIENWADLLLSNEASSEKQSKKEIKDKIEQFLSTYFNDRLYDANYLAHFYLNLIEHSFNAYAQDKVNEQTGSTEGDIYESQDIMQQHRKPDKVEHYVQLLTRLLNYLEDAVDYGTLAQKYLSLYKLTVDNSLKRDHTQLTFDLSEQINVIEPSALIKGTMINKQKRQHVIEKTQFWQASLDSAPTVKAFITKLRKKK